MTASHATHQADDTTTQNTYTLPKRILLIGNSYTSQIKSTLEDLIKQSPYSQTHLAFITSGGTSLAKHVNQASTIDTIKQGDWDIVVLQEQSQIPALAEYTQGFQEAVTQLSTIIKTAGAQPALYMTWGHREGDKINPELLPNYNTMQQGLSNAYLTAAQHNNSILAPIGLVWAYIRQHHDEMLGQKLYQADGSHPSAKGAYVAASVLMYELFRVPIATITKHKSVTDEEVEVIKEAILSVYQNG